MNTLATPRRIRRHRRFGAAIAIAAVATVGIADATSSFAVTQEGSATHTPADSASPQHDSGGFPVLLPESVLPIGILDLLDEILAEPTTALDLPQALLDQLGEHPIVTDFLGDEDESDEGTEDSDDSESPDTDESDDADEGAAPTVPLPAIPTVPDTLPTDTLDQVVGSLPVVPACDESEDEAADADTETGPIRTTLDVVETTVGATCDVDVSPAPEEDDSDEAPADEPQTTSAVGSVVTDTVTDTVTAVTTPAPVAPVAAPAPTATAPLTVFEPREGLL